MKKQQTTLKAFVAIAVALLLFPLVLDVVVAQDEGASVPSPDENGKHLFILSGQSNMVGLKHEESFIPAVTKVFGEDRVLVVKDAHSGQSIRSWAKANHEFPPPTTGRVPKVRGDFYDPLIKKVRTAIEGQSLQTVTFVWMQGESDLNNTAYDAYLKELLEQLQVDLDFKEINLVLGRISDAGLDNEKRLEGRLNIRRIQREFAEAHPRGAWVDTDDLNDRKEGDKVVHDLHYNAEGYQILGTRFAEKAIGLIKGKNKGTGETAARLSEPLLFSFAQMCDTQLGMGGYEHDVKTFGLAVDQINRMKPDFVVICGDLVGKANDKSWADFKRIKAGFKIPCHCAAGNHDVGNVPTAESLKLYRETIGKDYYTVEHKGYTFVIANTQLWKAPLQGESEKHDEWFKEVLAAAREKASPVVVVVHYPLFVKTPDEEENYYNIPPAKRMELLTLCEENGVVAFLAGHTHKLVVNDHKGIQLVNGETTSRNVDGRPMGFRWWDVAAQGKMVHRFIALEGMEE